LTIYGSARRSTVESTLSLAGSVTVTPVASDWPLFVTRTRYVPAGGQLGQPIGSDRLHQIGVHPGSARSKALVQLADEVPAAILARMLGIHIHIHIDVVVTWQRGSTGRTPAAWHL
jgi:hypothetical protein